ncbi:hypothetical protein MTOK_50040 [Mycolicibacterium tokaiense]|nr:hypothetical protein MTOK_50040 [Mycolicibacterium tokaiense]
MRLLVQPFPLPIPKIEKQVAPATGAVCSGAATSALVANAAAMARLLARTGFIDILVPPRVIPKGACYAEVTLAPMSFPQTRDFAYRAAKFDDTLGKL